MDNKKYSKTVIAALIFCAVAAILARISGIVYSFLATNVIYRESIICMLLPGIRQIFSSLSFAFAAGAAVCVAAEKKKIRVPMLFYGAVMFADGVAVITLDVFSGIFADEPQRLILGIGYRIGMVVGYVCIMLFGVILARAMMRRCAPIGIAAITAAVVPVAIKLIAVVYNSIVSLFEWDFMPYTNEILTIVYEIGVILLCGVLSAASVVIIVLRRNK